MLSQRFNEYYQLTKPGIIKGNLLAFTGVFLFASGRDIDFVQLVAASLATASVIASGCVFNNLLDVKIDSKMQRTQNRPLVTGKISPLSALIFGLFLSTSGIIVLSLYINVLTAILGTAALFLYVMVYGYAKRSSLYGTHVGTLPGAIPPVAGYTAVTAQLDMVAGLLFLAMSIWQIPHFFAISIFRLKEYQAAGIPVMPSVKNITSAKRQIVGFIGTYTLVVCLFGFIEQLHLTTWLLLIIPAVTWLVIALRDFSMDDEKWARKIFGISLVVLLLYSAALGLNAWLP